jgi:hypothetical protein
MVSNKAQLFVVLIQIITLYKKENVRGINYIAISYRLQNLAFLHVRPH